MCTRSPRGMALPPMVFLAPIPKLGIFMGPFPPLYRIALEGIPLGKTLPKGILYLLKYRFDFLLFGLGIDQQYFRFVHYDIILQPIDHHDLALGREDHVVLGLVQD